MRAIIGTFKLNPFMPTKNTNRLMRKANTPYCSGPNATLNRILAIKPTAWLKPKKRLIAKDSETSWVSVNLGSSNFSILTNGADRYHWHAHLKLFCHDNRVECCVLLEVLVK